jgi:hypothetical protein
MRKRKLKRRCYFCSEEGAASNDHIPPKGLFPKNIRKLNKNNLITVPAHFKCNNSFKKDDELFRNFIIAHSYETKQGRYAWDNVLIPSFKKNPGARKELVNRLDKQFIKDDLLNAYVYKDVMQIDESLYTRQIERIIKGLFFHRYKIPLPLNLPIHYKMYDEIDIILPKIIETFNEIDIPQNWRHIIPGFFSYFLEIAEDDNEKGLSVLIFYNKLTFYCSIGII